MTQVTITAVRVRAVQAPMTRPITTASGSIIDSPLVLIDIESSDGVTGNAYLFTYTPLALRATAQLTETVGEALIGKPLIPVDRFNEMERMFRLLGRQGLAAMAIAGLDMALWDAAAKRAGLSVAEMLGAGHAPLPCYDSYGMIVPGRDDADLQKSLSDGFKAVKIKVGGDTLAKDLEIIGHVRGIIGPDTKLLVDYNQSLTLPEAQQRLAVLAQEADIHWIEEPLPAEDFAGYQDLRAKTDIPIQAGENWWMPDDAARAIGAGTIDHAMIDIMKIGGVTGWLRAAPMAFAASLPVSSHIFVEASAHVMAATANAYLVEYLDLASMLLAEPYEIQNGCVAPRGPGLGMSWDEKAVARYAV